MSSTLRVQAFWPPISPLSASPNLSRPFPQRPRLPRPVAGPGPPPPSWPSANFVEFQGDASATCQAPESRPIWECFDMSVPQISNLNLILPKPRICQVNTPEGRIAPKILKLKAAWPSQCKGRLGWRSNSEQYGCEFP